MVNKEEVRGRLERFLQKNYASGLTVDRIIVSDNEAYFNVELGCDALGGIASVKEYTSKRYKLFFDDGREESYLSFTLITPRVLKALMPKKVYKELYWGCVQIAAVALGCTSEPVRVKDGEDE